MPSLNTVIKQASRGADLYFVFRFLRLLTMKYEKTDAYKYGIIDKKGKPLRKSSELESVDEGVLSKILISDFWNLEKYFSYNSIKPEIFLVDGYFFPISNLFHQIHQELH